LRRSVVSPYAKQKIKFSTDEDGKAGKIKPNV
jgi:hypothetical protein